MNIPSNHTILNHIPFKLGLFYSMIYLIGGLEHSFYSIQLGMSSSQLTNSYFSEGLKPPTRHIYIYVYIYIYIHIYIYTYIYIYIYT